MGKGSRQIVVALKTEGGEASSVFALGSRQMVELHFSLNDTPIKSTGPES